MVKKHPRIPVGLLIAVLVLLALGVLAGPIIRSRFTEQQLAANILLAASPFILIFVAIVLAYISLISFTASLLSKQILPRTYRVIEWIIIAGIIGGVIGMFQPWSFVLYRYGFIVLLISTLCFILWSHIVPRGVHRQEDLTTHPIAEDSPNQLR